MVNRSSSVAELDRIFGALSNPHRRAILAHLERADGVSVSDLARPSAMKLPAIMKHLDVLHDAGLITRAKRGRTVSVHLTAPPMRVASRWLAQYERFWAPRIDRIARYAEDLERASKGPSS